MTTPVAPNPQRIMQFAFGFVPSLAVSAAVELGVFQAIDQGHHTQVVAEMVAAEPRGSDVFSNLFDLNMLMWTEDGTVFTGAQLEEMCEQAGFSRCEWLTVPGPYPILLAHR